mmetsp:Transcript_9632/g.20322  ORF Transcript_9632/g.20322 Transcript_9632/m.20322 type:complete len:241 (-) Transcript_9632:346-1068(-)
MMQSATSRQPLSRIGLKQTTNEALRFRGHVLEILFREGVLTILDLGEHLVLFRAGERLLSCQQVVQDHASGPHIAERVVRLLFHNFWRDVVRCSHCRTKHVLLHRVDKLREPKVRELHLEWCSPVLAQQVFRFDISMHDVVLVQILKRFAQILHDECRVALAERALLSDHVIQHTTRHELKYYKQPIRSVKDVVGPYHTRVLEMMHDQHLSLQQPIIRLLHSSLFEHLNRNAFACLAVTR